ncbi:MAG: PhnD/SsuA/transferrin family substrate-binding protein [Hydrogenophaga sp.]|uniref:substrate-binding domain-containing protein n=1 Tax=Hydrogenophaga sp. TaxID=1904254 RepID=UPI0016B7A0CF|nr:PhnD/SsuA/transferrin family substrate-binding protein [Hydrogenophaga sp.]NIM42358.1 PhnD/SsuA/transferrin family substrate-binding protein [Hydrogenophaga sp.]NIN27513.1 PhnD/SsuA/transferrin family substrate-binding protein [Hydrogenophaga sp.]NIN32332.1 PhnD/SsuA/transferrin family substrate-binding protein [Hydrogenophaga sp.]NIN56566.1 PhnD/SsuA/transferrin family substrate-binding protein [Hydrogenophaga sp.]NIO52929.1 PhnD/SsuA/transferrin family substrate-binding protein [Hydrogeno
MPVPSTQSIQRPRRRREVMLAGLTAVVARPAWSRAAGVRFGLTPVFLDDRVRLLRRWGKVFEGTLGHSVQFVQFSAYNQVVDALRAGQLEFAWLCGYPFVLHRRDMRLVAVPQWRGRPLYQSYLIADADARVSRLDDLQGKTFAYSDPLSNSGFLYPQHLLRQQRRDPARHFGRSFFTYSHRHVVEAVAQGLAHAGAVDGYVWETLAEITPQVTARTRVILRSPDFGFPPIVAPAQGSAALSQAFLRALQAMGTHPEGQAVLQELRLDGFVAGEPALFDSIAAMVRGQQA